MRSREWAVDGGRAALIGSALLALAGCTSQPKGDPEIRDIETVEYTCENGTKLGLWFEPDTAIVTESGRGETLILPQKRSGSGIWYGNDQFDFRGKGDEATWTSGSQPPTTCHVAKSPPA